MTPQEPERMTIEERAEKLVSKLIVSRCTGEPEFFQLVKLIEDQITQACAEAKAEAQTEMYWNPEKVVYEKGYSAAREEAAKIVHIWSTNPEIELRILDEIRAMKVPIKPYKVDDPNDRTGKRDMI